MMTTRDALLYSRVRVRDRHVEADGDEVVYPDVSTLKKAARGRRRNAWDSVSIIVVFDNN
jgi:hypothetical protein